MSEFKLHPSKEHSVEIYLECSIDENGNCPLDENGNFITKMNICTKSEYLRLLKGLYSNKERFISRFLSVKKKSLKETEEKMDEISGGETPNKELMLSISKDFLQFLEDNYDDAKPFTYKEAFSIQNDSFRAAVFGSINVPEMMSNLKSKRIKTDGISVKHKKYTEDGTFIGTEDYHNVYETYEIDGKELGLQEKLYTIKCWCTSTNKEHWLWIDGKYKDNPLEAIASTFHIHKNLIPYIKEIKRQGDVLLLELTEDIKPEGEIVPLNKEQYFSKLTAQS